MLALPAPPQRRNHSTRKMTKEEKAKRLKEQEDEVIRRLKKTLIVEILIKIQNVKNEDINGQFRDMLLESNKNFYDLYGFYNKGIMALLKWWGDPEQVMTSFVRAIEEKERREREEKERLEREERERIKREKEEKERQEREERERR